MADARHFDPANRWRTALHLVGDLAGQKVGQLAADEQDRSGVGQALEQIPGDEGHRLVAVLAERLHDRGVIIELRGAVGIGEGAAGERRPVLGRIIRECTPIDPLEIRCGIVPAANIDLLADIAFDPFDPDIAHFRADIVEDQSGDGALAHAGDGEAHDPAHRRADENGAGDAKLVHQVENVAGVGVGNVIGDDGITVRQAAAADVGDDYPPAGRGDQRGKVAEILRVTGQSVQADDRQPGHAGGPRIIAGIERQSVLRRPPPLYIISHSCPHRLRRQ